MSVEALAVAAVVEDGISALRTLYASGVGASDFVLYDDEFKWVERRLVERKSLNRRVFRQRFPDFDWAVAKESVKDLAGELKEERAFEEMNAILAELADGLERDNAVEMALNAKERLNRVTRSFAPVRDSVLEEWKDDVEEMRRFRKLAQAGTPVGYQTGFAHLDHHMGGLLPGHVIQFLGRTGEGKSLKTLVLALEAKLQGATVGIFTPELSRHETKCRLHTVASARKEIQEACGLERSFRNRALLFRRGFNLKSYERFCRYFDEGLPGRMHLLGGDDQSGQMTVGYIEDRIVELGLDFVVVDPIYLLRPIRIYKDNPTQEVGVLAYALAGLAKTYNIPLVFTNQANRQGVQGDAPGKDRSYNSDIPNHVSDWVLGVKHISDENRMIVKCSKARHGTEFRYELSFFVNTGVIKEMTDLSGNYFSKHGEDDDAEDETDEVKPAKGKTKPKPLVKGKT